MRKQNRNDSSKTWLAPTLASLAAATVSADALLGVGHREFEDFRGQYWLSFMGGAKMMARVDGGLNEEAGANFLAYDDILI